MRHALQVLLALTSAAMLSAQTDAPRELVVNVGKSLVIDSPVDLVRVSVANPEVIEAVGISPREIVLNGKKAGETSVILWQKESGRLLFDVTVGNGRNFKLEVVQKELEKELSGTDVTLAVEGENVFLRGTVPDLTAADRAVAIASVLGKPVNLMRVNVPEMEEQILLKVKFADVDRASTQKLGVNLFSTGAANTIGAISAGSGGAPTLQQVGGGQAADFRLSDLLNIFLFRPDLNLGATIQLLESNRLIEILAEPNVLAINGKEASFLAGGEYPYPVVQGGGLGTPVVTIQFREFGIRLGFRPQLTSRDTIRLTVVPEVSALDFANGITFQGFNVPGLAVRRVSTEIELEDKQSFAIAGLLDNRVTETLNKMPGLGDIPLLGKLFQSRNREKSKSELLVLVTPEIVKPIPVGQPTPGLEFPKPFISEGGTSIPRTPGIEVTGRPDPKSRTPLPVEAVAAEKKREAEGSKLQMSGSGSGMGLGVGAASSGSAAGRQ